MLFYHFIILLAPVKFIGFGLFASFTGIIYIKIRQFNKFMQDHEKLAKAYTSNPKLIQKKYDAEMDIKVA
jgi:hypothetical protein